MFKKISKNHYSLIFIFLIAFSFQSCQSTRSLAKESIQADAPDDSTFIVAHDIVFPEIGKNAHPWAFLESGL